MRGTLAGNAHAVTPAGAAVVSRPASAGIANSALDDLCLEVIECISCAVAGMSEYSCGGSMVDNV